jgi:hypothetical protein
MEPVFDTMDNRKIHMRNQRRAPYQTLEIDPKNSDFSRPLVQLVPIKLQRAALGFDRSNAVTEDSCIERLLIPENFSKYVVGGFEGYSSDDEVAGKSMELDLDIESSDSTGSVKGTDDAMELESDMPRPALTTHPGCDAEELCEQNLHLSPNHIESVMARLLNPNVFSNYMAGRFDGYPSDNELANLTTDLRSNTEEADGACCLPRADVRVEQWSDAVVPGLATVDAHFPMKGGVPNLSVSPNIIEIVLASTRARAAYRNAKAACRKEVVHSHHKGLLGPPLLHDCSDATDPETDTVMQSDDHHVSGVSEEKQDVKEVASDSRLSVNLVTAPTMDQVMTLSQGDGKSLLATFGPCNQIICNRSDLKTLLTRDDKRGGWLNDTLIDIGLLSVAEKVSTKDVLFLPTQFMQKLMGCGLPSGLKFDYSRVASWFDKRPDKMERHGRLPDGGEFMSVDGAFA